MVRKITLAVVFGAGYLLGARAGEERYTQIQGQVRALLGHPAVQQFTGTVSASAGAATGQAPDAGNEPVSATSDPVSSAGPNAISVDPTAEPATSPGPRSIEEMSELELELATRPTPPAPSS